MLIEFKDRSKTAAFSISKEREKKKGKEGRIVTPLNGEWANWQNMSLDCVLECFSVLCNGYP